MSGARIQKKRLDDLAINLIKYQSNKLLKADELVNILEYISRIAFDQLHKDEFTNENAESYRKYMQLSHMVNQLVAFSVLPQRDKAQLRIMCTWIKVMMRQFTENGDYFTADAIQVSLEQLLELPAMNELPEAKKPR